MGRGLDLDYAALINLAVDHSITIKMPSNRYAGYIPHGWEQRIEEQDRDYYAYHNTSRTTWQHPHMTNVETHWPFSTAFNTGWNLTNENYYNSFHYENWNNEPRTVAGNYNTCKSSETKIIDDFFGSLPEGWEIQSCSATNRTIYTDCITKKILEYDPRLQNFFNLGSPLPENWEIRVSPGQLPLFVNHNFHEKKTYRDPRIGLDSYASEGNFIKCDGDTREKTLLFQQLCKAGTNYEELMITLSRENILEDSFCQIMCVTTTNLHRSLLVSFYGEVGIDHGGLAREWFYLITKEICNPIYGLFKTSTSETYSIQINPNSSVNPNHLLYFCFLGRLLAMALFHRYFIYGGFDINFYKQILRGRQTMEDLQNTDITTYNSLKWICENDIEKEGLELYFFTESDFFGKMIVTELIPGGKEVRVTQSNKSDYVNLFTEWILSTSTFEQMNAIRTAFFEVIPCPWVAFFDEKELENLLCGIQSFDVKDWRNNTEYGKGYRPDSKQIKWFWNLVESFNSEQRARLLQFATGTSHLPVTGFADLYGAFYPQKFNINKSGATTHLPESHTCFNRINLPPYNTFEELKSKLLTAIEESSGFHIK